MHLLGIRFVSFDRVAVGVEGDAVVAGSIATDFVLDRLEVGEHAWASKLAGGVNHRDELRAVVDLAEWCAGAVLVLPLRFNVKQRGIRVCFSFEWCGFATGSRRVCRVRSECGSDDEDMFRNYF